MALTQRELELEMFQIGKEATERMHATSEEKGQASRNPYASAVHRRFVEPLAKALSTKYTGAAEKRGRTARIKVLMKGMDPLVTAYLGVRVVLNLLVPAPETKATSLAVRVGTTIYGELLLRTFEDINPALFHVLTRDLTRRMSKNERHRISVFRHEAKAHGIPFPEWGTSDKALVGTAILREMEDLGLVVRSTVVVKGATIDHYDLHPKIRHLLESIKEFIAMTRPMHMPCVEPPKPWVTPNDGGWHTPEMRRADPTCITSESFVNDEDVPQPVLDALNALQATRWRINTRLLSAVQNVARHFDVGEVMSQAELPRPPKPMWLTEDMKKEHMNDDQLSEFMSWKRDVAAWHTEKKSRNTRWGRFYEAMRVANRLKDQDSLWFVYQMDYRSRFYAKSRGVSPQGSDLQKALIRCADGGRINSSPESVFWFKVNGANRYGYDKAELADRAKWVDDHDRHILAMAADPISNRDWTEADKPFQFLAWCFEYADWRAFPNEARTYLPVGLDGSCNGLQHFSAATRDEIGGAATNLTPGPRRDIYEIVAMRLTEILREEEPCELRDTWLRHGITRKLTKRSVMTLPYGATRFACSDFIMKDYLQKGLAPEFAKDDYIQAATWLSHRLWAAIGDVVVKGQEAMAWLQRAAREVVEKGHEEVVWTTPNGFRVRQRYSVVNKLRLVSRLHGSTQITLSLREYDEDTVDGRRHMQGIAPNFVHSLDASHMQRVIWAAQERGITALAMIHDDYGTTADRTQELYTLIRDTFVGLYQNHDPLAEFAEELSIETETPVYGTLRISEVADSEHFFS